MVFPSLISTISLSPANSLPTSQVMLGFFSSQSKTVCSTLFYFFKIIIIISVGIHILVWIRPQLDWSLNRGWRGKSNFRKMFWTRFIHVIFFFCKHPRDFNLYINPEEGKLRQQASNLFKFTYLGHHSSAANLKVGLEKIKEIQSKKLCFGCQCHPTKLPSQARAVNL